ncbi:hypothetical protein ACP70R_009331 [Stipagrostis hirtigluma subsp. patula]
MSGAQEECSGGGVRGHGSRRRRVLMFPLPFQGHINPMLQLAGVLHARGLAVTVLHTHFNALDPARHPDFAFVPVRDGVPADVAASRNINSIVLAMNEAMEASADLREALAAALAGDEGQPLATCLVIDANLVAVQRAAAGLGLPTLVLRTGSAANFGCFLAYPMLHQKGYLPPQDAQLYTPVKELPPLRVRDLVYSGRSNHEMLCKLIAQATEAVRNSCGLVINTFDALEATELQKIRDELDNHLVLAVGPLHKLSPKNKGSSLLDQDCSCIEWLDKHPSRSVLYVSFGSLASMDSNEFMEVASGLVNSGHPFLWVVRPGLVRGSDESHLLDELKIAVEDRGKVIQWAPQLEVLAHRAVGGFWTHSGWNSTLEGISEGIPMICRPKFSDQMMNTRYVEEVWGVGLELEGELERGKVEKAIRTLMAGNKGAEMTDRANELKNKVADCLKIGGSSQTAIDKLVYYIHSL